MTIDPMHTVLDSHVAAGGYETILDVGGWFLPYPRATHVVDLMPWETRSGKLQLAPRPEEKYTKSTWTCLDICDTAARLPYPDKSVDFVICSGTLEDLPDPRHCAREMERVGRAGYIRVPSMLSELTVGVEDRTNSVIGYHHHHWICRAEGTDKLVMLAKADAGLARAAGRCVPHTFFERRIADGHAACDRDIHFFWKDGYSLECVSGPAVREEVTRYINSLGIRTTDYYHDRLLRTARALRDRIRGKARFGSAKDSWWAEMLRISKPYSDPELFRRAGGYE
jgi:hypothetical protein